jgi:hypothetical protein
LALAVADGGATGLGFVAPGGDRRCPDVVVGFGLTAGAPVIGSGALLIESSTGGGFAVRAGVAFMDGLGTCVTVTGGGGSSTLMEPSS